ncbi:hypothetical protein MYCTH_2306085 [Thermothelomyces thermophilus ATCC 42464]|uniref:Enoyl reductase (ER) domain-containing protein n=1 Tax=Thermothelomyces thermophilus (strain ATCC 42464 / BCRC 31852 / DSM 1799) TaxID=573729 RepID=G2QGQ9_THET4|nr:uncharacterized protein MYCTH_2306085 [Thermothelomyces thermophilus ATCC 42464]AEO58621.1 hypothetical protein MYCTH_2306085 [Thermothelomyces thermophilus ATCC 42464]
MRCWTATSRGSPRQALTLNPAAPTPSLPADGPPSSSSSSSSSSLVLVRITHVTLNPADLNTLRLLPPWLPFRRAPVPGMDFAGEVVALGGSRASTDADAAPPPPLRVGDRVCGAAGLREVFTGRGTLAEFVLLDRALVTPVPAGWGGREAAGTMGIAGQTATAMVKRVVPGGDLRSDRRGLEGRRVLVNGASGGVGTVLVQICKGLGAAEVVGVCSGANEGLVKGLGADEVVDYRLHDPLETHLVERFGEHQFDVIFDCAGSQGLYSCSPGYLKPEGRFVSIVGGWSQGVVPYIRNKLRPVFLGGTPRSYDLFLLSASGEIAREVATLVEQGVIKQAVIDSEFPMEQAVEAFEKLATGRARGKIVVNISNS